MSFVGNLEDLTLEEILQMIHFSRKSGVVSLNFREMEANVIFSEGAVVGAISTNIDDRFADIFIEKKLISDQKAGELLAALKVGKTAFQWFLNELELDDEKREEFVATHVEQTIYSLLDWTRGNFSFELLEDIDGYFEKNEKMPARLAEGLNPNYLLMEGTRRADERKRNEDVTRTQLADMGDYETVVDFRQTATSDTASNVVPFRKEDDKPPAARSPVAPAPAPPPVAPAPVAPAPAPSPAAATSATAIEEIEPRKSAAKRSRKLVLTDDDPVCGKAFIEFAADRGFKAAYFKDNKTFLSKIDQLMDESPRPIFIADLIMPKSDASGLLGGIEILELVRERDPGTAVVVIADLFNEEAKNKAEELGVSAFLDKPKRSKFDDGEQTGDALNFLLSLFRLLEELDATLPGAAAADDDESEWEAEEDAAAPTARAASDDAPAPAASDDEDYFDISAELSDELDKPRQKKKDENPRLRVLKSMIGELLGPEAGTEITLLILRFAAEIVNRAAIFLVTEREAIGLGQFSINSIDPSALNVRRVRIPLNGPSLFKRVIDEKYPYRGPLDENPLNDLLVEGIGGTRPGEVYAAPIVSRGRVAAILYGDDMPEQKPIGDTEMLEIFLAQAGMAMEKALLEKLLRESQSHEAGKRSK